MRKLKSILLLICLVFSLAASANAMQENRRVNITYRGINITIDGKELIPVDAAGRSVEPFIYNGTTYLPVRGVANALDLSVDWDSDTNTVLLTSGGTAITPVEKAKSSHSTVSESITYRDIQILLNGEKLIPKGADGSIVEPFIMDGTTYLPVRAVSEALALFVDWNNETDTVILSTATDGYKVLRVVDGDTIVVDYNGTEEKVRMIGIDTPESVHPDSERNTAQGKKASKYTESMLEGKYVTLEFDVQERDKYGRFLAYVYLNGKMFNKTLLENGYAVVSTYPPNVKYVNEFVKIANAANGSAGENDSAKEEKSEESVVKKSGTYVGSVESNKYHYPTCGYAEKIAESNEIWFDTESEAAAAGYSPCGICKP